MNRAVVVLVAALAAILPTGCDRAQSNVFAAGTTMAALQHAGRIRIGVKSDQPSLGFRNPSTNEYEGFDIELATIVAAELGLGRNQIDFITTTSAIREQYLIGNGVDIVVASYSMNERRQTLVGQAGPYFVTGQQVLVRRADKATITGPQDLPADRVCSALGSTSIDNWEQRYTGRPVAEATYTECVQRLLTHSVDAVTTDGAVLLGYVAQLPTKLVVVGEPFSIDTYGIGYRKGDRPFCEFLTEVIAKAERDGRWDRAFSKTLGKAGVPAPTKPPLQACRA